MAEPVTQPTLDHNPIVVVGDPARVLYPVTDLTCPYGLTPYDRVDGQYRDVLAQGLGRTRVDNWQGPPRRPPKQSLAGEPPS